VRLPLRSRFVHHCLKTCETFVVSIPGTKIANGYAEDATQTGNTKDHPENHHVLLSVVTLGLLRSWWWLRWSRVGENRNRLRWLRFRVGSHIDHQNNQRNDNQDQKIAREVHGTHQPFTAANYITALAACQAVF